MSLVSSAYLQKAVINALKAHSGVSGIVSNKIFDTPPGTATKPYIVLGPSDGDIEPFDEYDGYTETLQIDAYTAGPTKAPAKLLAAEIVDALHRKELSLDGNQSLRDILADNPRIITEPDGITQHVVVVLTARTEPTA